MILGPVTSGFGSSLSPSCTDSPHAQSFVHFRVVHRWSTEFISLYLSLQEFQLREHPSPPPNSRSDSSLQPRRNSKRVRLLQGPVLLHLLVRWPSACSIGCKFHGCAPVEYEKTVESQATVDDVMRPWLLEKLEYLKVNGWVFGPYAQREVHARSTCTIVRRIHLAPRRIHRYTRGFDIPSFSPTAVPYQVTNKIRISREKIAMLLIPPIESSVTRTKSGGTTSHDIDHKNINFQTRKIEFPKVLRKLPDPSASHHPEDDVRTRVHRHGTPPRARRFATCIQMIGWLRVTRS